MASIYEITNDIIFIQTLLEENGEVDPEALKGALEVSKEDLALKLEGYCKVIKNFESDISGLKEEEARLKAKRETLENTIKRMKEAMQSALDTAMKDEPEKKLKCGLFTCAIQKNTPSVVLDCDDNLVPAKYLIPQDPKVDKKAIKKDLDDGVDLSGVAHLSASEFIRIR